MPTSPPRTASQVPAPTARPVDGAVPHPIPYQGSKRALATRILGLFPPGRSAAPAVLHEPFAGSAAVSLAALQSGRVGAVHLGDVNAPLIDLWRAVAEQPHELANCYDEHWRAQGSDPAGYYADVRAAFNADPRPDLLLYLLARCVKAAVRYNGRGEFNQSADHRRLGRHPRTMRSHLLGTHALVSGRVALSAADFEVSLAAVSPDDVVYLDPPYQGVSSGPDGRYVEGVEAARLVRSLAELVERQVMFVLSYDGRCGDRSYGEPLPSSLGLTRRLVDAGRSASATLHGRHDRTVESLYLSPALVAQVR